MTQSETDVVVHEIRIRAARETVFSYFTDPARMVEWFGTKATLDPRPGGVFQVDVTRADTASGTFLEVDPPNRAVFTFGWVGGDLVPPGASTVEVRLFDDGDATIVRLTHRDLPLSSVEKHNDGWTHFLGRLFRLFEPLGDVENAADETTNETEAHDREEP
ncbi:MAG: SRPBCC family protein [Gaiellaceae bacterium]